MSQGNSEQGTLNPPSVLSPGTPAPDFTLRSAQS